MKILKCEIKKLAHSKIWLPILIIPLFANVFGSINYSMNREILTKEWVSLWTQVYLFYGMVFYPGVMGIICAYIWNQEHKSDLKHLLLMPHKTYKYVLSKNLIGYALAILVQAYFMACYIFIGKFVFKFSSPAPIVLLRLGAFAAFMSIQMITVQNYLPLRIKAFAPPIGVAIVLAIVGFFVSATNIIGPFKYLYANGAISHAMNAYPGTEFSLREILLTLVFCVITSIIFTKLTNNRLEKVLK